MGHLKTILVSLVLLGGLFILTPMSSMAATDLVGNDICSKAPNSSVCQSKTSLGNKNPLFGPEGVLTRIIYIISLIIGIVAVIMIIIGGLRFITGGNNPQEVEKARNTIIYAIAGLIIALLAQAIVQLFLKKLN